MHKDYLLKKYEFLKEMKPNERGRNLETLVTEIFQYGGFDAFSTQSLTRFGDQIDIHVFSNRNIIVECKWEKSSVSLKQIKSFHSTLREREPITIGLFIGMNGFSKNALDFIKHNPDRLIIVLAKEELLDVIKCTVDIEILIERKIGYMQRGIIFIHKKTDPLVIHSWPLTFPSSTDEITIKKEPWISIEDERSRVALPICFTRRKLSPSLKSGQFYTISFFPEKETVYSNFLPLLDALTYYNKFFGFSNETIFGISQSGINWYGFGVNNFLLALYMRKERYNPFLKKQIDFHHCEAAFLFDFWGPRHFMALAFDPDVTIDRREFVFRRMKMVIYSDQFPYEDERITLFAKRANLYYEFGIQEIKSKFLDIKQQKTQLIYPFNYHINPEMNLIEGGLVENPFYRKQRTKIDSSNYDDPIIVLEQFKEIPVHLKDHFNSTGINKKELHFTHCALFTPNFDGEGLKPIIADIGINW